MAINTQNTISDPAAFVVPVGHRISWGAVFAGLSMFLALSWLLMLLGAALGAGIADATDLAAMGNGLGIASIIWLLLTSLVATFAGALLAAKLAGTADDRIGALHGVTVWSAGTLLIIFMGMSGSGALINAISGAVGSATQMSSTVITNVSGGDGGDMLPDAITTSVAAVLKRQAARVISATASGNDGPSRSDVRSALNSLTAEDTGAIASALVSGDTDNARRELAQRTELSTSEIDSVIRGAEKQAEQWTESEQLQQAETWLSRQVNEARRSVSQMTSDMAGPEVSSREVNRALRELDADTVIEAGRYLVMGQPEMSKDVLVANTNLSETDINAIIDGAEQQAQEMLDKATAELEEASETVGTYTQAALWTAFIAAALGLVAGMIGGHMGAGTIRRLYANR